ncbi:hypothetical protein V8F06_011180 [Rhypophila decipiens]
MGCTFSSWQLGGDSEGSDAGRGHILSILGPLKRSESVFSMVQDGCARRMQQLDAGGTTDECGWWDLAHLGVTAAHAVRPDEMGQPGCIYHSRYLTRATVRLVPAKITAVGCGGDAKRLAILTRELCNCSSGSDAQLQVNDISRFSPTMSPNRIRRPQVWNWISGIPSDLSLTVPTLSLFWEKMKMGEHEGNKNDIQRSAANMQPSVEKTSLGEVKVFQQLSASRREPVPSSEQPRTLTSSYPADHSESGFLCGPQNPDGMIDKAFSCYCESLVSNPAASYTIARLILWFSISGHAKEQRS